MPRRAKPKLEVSVTRGFSPFDPHALRLFSDRGSPLLSRSMMAALEERRQLLRLAVHPISLKGAELPAMPLKDLLWDVVGSKRLKQVDPHTTVDSALEALDRAHEELLFEDRVLDQLFQVSGAVPVSDLRLSDLPMSGRLRGSWDVLLARADATVSDTLGFSMRQLRDVDGGWSVVAEWAVLLEHFCVDPESFGLFQDVGSALTLDRASELVAEELIRADGGRLSAVWVDALRRRKSWGLQSATLDAIGQKMGVTRERVRQIEARLFQYQLIRVWPLPAALGGALEVALDFDVSEASFGSELKAAGLALTTEWSRESLADLFDAMGRRADADAVRAAIEAAEQEAARARREDRELLDHVRRSRSHMGFLNLGAVEDGVGRSIPEDRVSEIVHRKYQRVATFKGWALAGVEQETAAENAALAQLGVAHSLPAHVVVEGLDRIARKRQDVALPPAGFVMALLEGIGCLAVDDGMVSPLAPVELPESGSNDRWLYELLVDQPGESMHGEEVMRIARADGRKEASIGVHLTYSPIVRREAGVISLVGADLDPAERARIRRVAAAKRVDSDYSVEWTDRGPVLTLTMGTAYLTSTVVGMRRDILGSTTVSGLGTACCRAYRSEARLGVSGSTAVYGWTTLFRHWVTAHGVSEGDEVRVLLGESLVSTLEPWAQVEPDARIASAAIPAVVHGREPESAEETDGTVLWSIPEQPVQLGIALPDEPSPASAGEREPRHVRVVGSRRSDGVGSADLGLGLWDVPVQGTLEVPNEGYDTAAPVGVDGTGADLGAPPPSESRALPIPGLASARPQGDVRLTLSMARADIVVSRDGFALSERYGSEARELAAAWLRIRPSGGRVWVDADGFATTLLGDQLVYLGRVPPEWALG